MVTYQLTISVHLLNSHHGVTGLIKCQPLVHCNAQWKTMVMCDQQLQPLTSMQRELMRGYNLSSKQRGGGGLGYTIKSTSKLIFIKK